MAAFLVSGSTPINTSSGNGMTIDGLAEDVLDVIFCHYEPPTSERAQLRAAQEAPRDPAKYAYRKATKPILRPSSTRSRAQKLAKLARQREATAAAETPTSSTKKSVTWRDEQNHRNRVERGIVGCAADYCGFFRKGEGLADILMSPTAAAAANASVTATNVASPTMTCTTTTTTPTSLAVSDAISSVTTANNKTAGSDNDATPKRVLYDDLGNPIPEGQDFFDEDDDGILADENFPPTTPSSVHKVPTTPQQSVVARSTPTAAGDPFSYYVMAPLAAAATMMGVSSATSRAIFPSSEHASTTTTIASKESGSGTLTPSSLRAAAAAPAAEGLPPPLTATSGITAEYYEDMGVYEPDNYDKPMMARQLPYRRVRAPTPLKRIPTPRFSRAHFEAEYDDNMNYQYYNKNTIVLDVGDEQQDDPYYSKQVRESSDQAEQTLARTPPRRLGRGTPRQGGRSAAARGTMNIQIPGPSSQSTPKGTFPSSRSDVCSDLTEEEGFYLQQRGAVPVEADDEFLYFYDDRGNLMARRRPKSSKRSTMPKLTKEEQAKIFYNTPVASKRPSTDLDDDNDSPLVIEGNGDEQQLSPREYAKHLARQRQAEETDACDGESPEEDDQEEDENLSPRQYAEKIRKQRQTTKKSNITSIKTEDDIVDDQFNRRAGKVVLKKETGLYGNEEYEADRARDPTPRNGAPLEESNVSAPNGQLPPTPRREDEDEDHREYNFDKDANRRAQRAALMRQLSPMSMATDDEIREEVSSVGMMTPSTLRPMHNYPNTHTHALPELVLDGQDEEHGAKVDRGKNTSMGSRSTLSSNPSNEQNEKAQRKSESSRRRSSEQLKKSQRQHHPEVIPKSSSGSTRSKKLWRGWKKTVGRVKQIVNDIEEERLPLPPALRHCQKAE